MRYWRNKEPIFFFFFAESIQRCPIIWTLWTVACQAPLSIGFCRQEYWSGLPCPSFRGSSQLREEPVSLRFTCFDRRALYHQHHLGSPSKEPEIGKTVLKAWPYQIWEISMRLMGFSGGARGKEPAWQWRIRKRHGVPSLGLEDLLVATHSSILAWRITWTEEPGRLQSTGLHRVRQYWSDLACMQVR